MKRTRVPVRSLTDKLHIGGLAIGWVTTSESLPLYVFAIFVFAKLLLFVFSRGHWSD